MIIPPANSVCAAANETHNANFKLFVWFHFYTIVTVQKGVYTIIYIVNNSTSV